MHVLGVIRGFWMSQYRPIGFVISGTHIYIYIWLFQAEKANNRYLKGAKMSQVQLITQRNIITADN